VKIHAGQTERAGLLHFIVDGCWLKLSDEPARFSRYEEPRNQDRDLRGLYGLSGRTWFLGFMRLGKPTENQSR